jgi:hypothetical protein
MKKLLIVLIFLSSCTTPSLISPRPTGDDPILSDTQFTEYTFMPGRHQSYKDGTSTLNIFSQTLYNYKRLNNISYTVVFDSSAVYDWKGDPDQLDWNKGGALRSTGSATTGTTSCGPGDTILKMLISS